MGWPYQFIDLSEAERHARRLSLDRYGLIAQLSSLLPVAVILLYRVSRWLIKKVAAQRVVYDVVPTSPAAKHQKQSSSATWAATVRRVAWWLGDDIQVAGQSWGQRDQMVVGFAWSAWLLFLCVVGTGNDYFHITKKFGTIAASQLPIQYLLALKYWNPVAYAFGSSHEEVNRWHRVLGRIIYSLLCLHGAFYINAWVQIGVLEKKVVESIVILGILSLIGMTLLNSTAISIVRQLSYRVFFLTHLLVAIALPPAIFFHVHHARVFMMEALGVFLVDMATRKLTTVTAQAALEVIPGTNLIKIRAEISERKANLFREHPATHVYMSIPPASRPNPNPASISSLLFEGMFNPFTVASVDDKSGELTLVIRRLHGPITQTLNRLAAAELSETKVPLSLEGPYGVSRNFPNFAGPDFDRVLLVAGGVGATFIIPIYQQIISDNPSARVDLIWVVRDAAEATWPVSGAEAGIIDDDRVQMFLTGSIIGPEDESGSAVEGVEAVELSTLPSGKEEQKPLSAQNRKRPDLRKIVDDVFQKGREDRVAVLVCGPDGMATDMRQHVGKWVKMGRKVWWHNESFGW